MDIQFLDSQDKWVTRYYMASEAVAAIVAQAFNSQGIPCRALMPKRPRGHARPRTVML